MSLNLSTNTKQPSGLLITTDEPQAPFVETYNLKHEVFLRLRLTLEHLLNIPSHYNLFLLAPILFIFHGYFSFWVYNTYFPYSPSLEVHQ